MIEVEVKARAPEDMADRIIALGGKLKVVEIHCDLYFNSPLCDFRKSDEALRIRMKNDGARLTYKGPKLDDSTKSRKELTVKIDDPKTMQEILLSLGYVLSAKVMKRRSKYTYPGVIIALDEVEGLGRFLEIEAEGDGDYHKARDKVLEIMSRLGLSESIRSSYLELLEERKLELAAGKSRQIR